MTKRTRYSKFRWSIIGILALATVSLKNSYTDLALALAFLALVIAVYDEFFIWSK